MSSESNFIIDIGNSRIKSSEVQDNKILESKTWEQLEPLVEALPKNKKTNCHIHIDGKLNGAQVAGLFGSENKVLPIIAKGPTAKLASINAAIFASCSIAIVTSNYLHRARSLAI